MPTISSFGTGKPVDDFRISASTPGAILQPQPPPCENEVSLMVWSLEFMMYPVVVERNATDIIAHVTGQRSMAGPNAKRLPEGSRSSMTPGRRQGQVLFTERTAGAVHRARVGALVAAA